MDFCMRKHRLHTCRVHVFSITASLIPSVEKGIEAIILPAVLFYHGHLLNLAPSGFDTFQSESIIYLLISVYSMH